MKTHRRWTLEQLDDRIVPTLIPKSFVIAIDGLRGDGILNANAPYMQSLIAGTWGDAPGIEYNTASADYAQTIKDAVTVSGPNHTSIFTGVTAAKHGVTGNSNTQMAAVTYPDYLQLLENDSPLRRTAKIVTWPSDDLVPTGADYRRVASDAANMQLAADIAAGVPGTPYAIATGTTEIDAIFVFVDDVDHAGHSAGFSPAIPTYLAEVADVDAQVGLVLDAIRNRPTFAQEDWQIVVTSDHGGRGTGHGVAAADNYTIPFIVSNRAVLQGNLADVPGNVDVAPTVLTHFGVAIPANIDGVARGSQIRTVPALPLTDGLVTNLQFDGTLQDSSANAIHATIGGGAPTYVAGKFGQAISLKAATGDWLTLGNPAALQAGTTGDFSFSLWYRTAAAVNGDPAILSNKNWNIGTNPGFVLSANQNNGNDVGLNIADTNGTKNDVNLVEYSYGQWWYLAGSIDHDGYSTLYVGSPDGIFFKIAQPIPLADLNSNLPWNIGQDGTGTYAFGLTADIDELSLWNRELRDEDFRTLYGEGNGVPTPNLLAVADGPYITAENIPLSISAPGVLANDLFPSQTLYEENFETAVLGPAVDEVSSDPTAWTDQFPGWFVDDSGVPGAGTANDGVTEWAGWSFADKNFWTTVSANQNRTDFTRGQGVVAVADPDEWDDLPHASGTYNAFMTTPAISLAGTAANSAVISFDSSFRPEGNQQASVDVSYDDFANFTRIFTRLTEDVRNEGVSIPLNNPSSGTVKFRFGLTDAGNNWWWAVDNLKVTGQPLITTFAPVVDTQPAHGSVVLNADGSFLYTPATDYSGPDQFTYSISSMGEVSTAAVAIVMESRPTVAAVTVNDGSIQRSRISTLTLAFDTIVDPVALQLANTFTLRRALDNATVGTISIASMVVNNATIVTLTVDGANTEFGSLEDGRWSLSVVGANVIDTVSGLPMLGVPTVFTFHRLFGDINGDATVDGPNDFAAFGSVFGNTLPGNPFDFNDDGVINGTVDFAQFGTRFGRTL